MGKLIGTVSEYPYYPNLAIGYPNPILLDFNFINKKIFLT